MTKVAFFDFQVFRDKETRATFSAILKEHWLRGDTNLVFGAGVKKLRKVLRECELEEYVHEILPFVTGFMQRDVQYTPNSIKTFKT